MTALLDSAWYVELQHWDSTPCSRATHTGRVGYSNNPQTMVKPCSGCSSWSSDGHPGRSDPALHSWLVGPSVCSMSRSAHVRVGRSPPLPPGYSQFLTLHLGSCCRPATQRSLHQDRACQASSVVQGGACPCLLHGICSHAGNGKWPRTCVQQIEGTFLCSFCGLRRTASE